MRKRRGSGKPTITDVAELAGVSAITVSRTLRTPSQVSEATRKKVTDAVAELDYRPDPAAVALASSQSTLIGVLIPSVTNSVFSDVMRGMHHIVDSTRFSIQFANTRYDPETELKLLRQFLAQRPAGLIVTGRDLAPQLRAELAQANCPVVQIMELDALPIGDCVGFDHADAARLAASHLIAAGYTKIGYLGAREDARSQERLAAFSQHLQAQGLYAQDRMIPAKDPASIGLGRHLAAQLFDEGPACDAILCNNDLIAVGALFECQHRAIRVGPEFGICGFNDIEMMAQCVTPITSIITPREAVGAQAVTRILARIEDPDLPPVTQDLGVQLIARASTAR